MKSTLGEKNDELNFKKLARVDGGIVFISHNFMFCSLLFLAGWPFGSVVCKLSGMVQGISVSASVFTLVAIAVDR